MDEDDVWYTLPSVPEQDAVSIDRTVFERYLDTGYFAVVEPTEPVKEVEASKTLPGVPYEVGDKVYLDDTAFEITNIGLFDVQLRDPTLAYPIFRSESKERLMQQLHQDERNQFIFDREEPKVTHTTETVAPTCPAISPTC